MIVIKGYTIIATFNAYKYIYMYITYEALSPDQQAVLLAVSPLI